MKNNQPRHIWSRANAGEILPGPVTPLTWSVFLPVLRKAVTHKAWSLLTPHWKWELPGGEWPESPRLINGRAYMELASVFTSFGSYPGVTTDVLHQLLGFEFHLLQPGELPVRKPRRSPVDVIRAVCFWMEMLGITHILASQAVRAASSSRWPVFVPKTDNVAPIRSLLDEIFRLEDSTAKVFGFHLQATSLLFSAYGLIVKLIEPWVGPDDLHDFSTCLLADFQMISTLQQNIDLWALAQKIQDSPAAMGALLNNPDAARQFLELRENDALTEVFTAWDKFICQFGDRSSEEFELSKPHWGENPEFLFTILRECIQNHTPNPQERIEQQHAKEKEIESRIFSKLRQHSSVVRLGYLRRLMGTYRRLIPLRENLKYLVIRHFNQLRKAFLEIGDFMVQEQIIHEREDVFYLSQIEIAQVIEKKETRFHEILTRREEFKRQSQTTAADLWIRQGTSEGPFSINIKDEEQILKGIGCSRGVVCGIARVLSLAELDNSGGLQGCILVLPSVDPGLTPILLNAAGLVTEIGGILSHGATVAREMGIPAVMSIPDATHLIKDGQWVTVDGSQGTVILAESKQKICK